MVYMCMQCPLDTNMAESRMGLCTCMFIYVCGYICMFTYVCGYVWFMRVCSVLLIRIWLKLELGIARVCLCMCVNVYACLHMYVGMYVLYVCAVSSDNDMAASGIGTCVRMHVFVVCI